jgi:hypothetical protein
MKGNESMSEIIEKICKKCIMNESGTPFRDRCREVISNMIQQYDKYEMLRVLNEEIDREITTAAERIPEKAEVDNLEIHLSAAVFNCYYALIVDTFKLADNNETYNMLSKATLDRVFSGLDGKARPGQRVSIYMKIVQDDNRVRGIEIT